MSAQIAAQTARTPGPVFTVKRQSPRGNWGVYRNGELVEGGFFDRSAAEECRATWEGFIPAAQS